MIGLPFRDLPPVDDPALLAAREDVAAAYLRDTLSAATYSDGDPRTVVTATLPVRGVADAGAPVTTELLFGEAFTVYATGPDGWSWGQGALDGYVGYVANAGLGRPVAPTHRVAALCAHVYPRPDLKMPPLTALSLGCRVAVRGWSNGYAEISPDGFVSGAALGPLEPLAADPVSVAQRLMGVPYLWGGRSSAGIDCSGLLQLALSEAGVAAHRDSHVQERTLGDAIPVPKPGAYRRGDIVFFPGHVGLMADDAMLLHANATAMAVSLDPVELVAARVEATEGRGITTVRRLASLSA